VHGVVHCQGGVPLQKDAWYRVDWGEMRGHSTAWPHEVVESTSVPTPALTKKPPAADRRRMFTRRRRAGDRRRL
jgi:hypothetical protein